SEDEGMEGKWAFVPLDRVPLEAVQVAADFLREWGAAEEVGAQGDPDGDSWEGAVLAPLAIKVYDPAFRDGLEPAYVEFKVVAGSTAGADRGDFFRSKGVAEDPSLGFVLVSLHEGDIPLPGFAQRGATPLEKLLSGIPVGEEPKVMRYGDAFSAVENQRGELLASVGADPFRPGAGALRLAGRTFTGQFDSEKAAEPMAEGSGGDFVPVEHYGSYAEFKSDYLTNEVYRLMREQLSRVASLRWGTKQGLLPDRPVLIQMAEGGRLTILTGETVTRAFLDADGELASLAYGTAGRGLSIFANSSGEAELTVETARGKRAYFLRVTSGGGIVAGAASGLSRAGFVPGWQPWKKYYSSPDGYAGMARYSQAGKGQGPLWCDAVGCGPVAWAILVHWWEHHGVPAAYYEADNLITLNTVDSPAVIPYYPWIFLNDLHEFCDVICDPFGDSGATWPSDMIEGGPTYLWLAKLTGMLKYSYAWAWDLLDNDWNEPANRVRASVKNGRPAIIGLGWLWHYGVAYGYAVREYKVTEDSPPVIYERIFKVNEGWGRDHGVWYRSETFLGASIAPWQAGGF
ncbi:MAG: hypothetical protein ACO34E_19480, partial [Limisphaerales bacterium]